MKKIIFFLMVAFSSLLLNAQNSDKVPFQIRSLTNETIKNVQIETSGGNISIAGISQGEARIEVYVQPNNSKGDVPSKEEIQKRIDEKYDLKIEVIGDKLLATAKAKKNMDWQDWKNALNVSFKVFITKNVSTQLSTSGGNISLKDVTGNQNFKTSGGNLSIDNVGGKIRGKTSGGNLRVYNSKDDIELSTSGGNINADGCSGNIVLSTSGGSLRLSNLSGNIKAGTSGGSVNGEKISGELITHTSGGSILLKELSCSLETSTSGGSIDVAIKELGKYIKIHNSGGSIDLELPKNKGIDLDLSASRVKANELNNFSGSKEDDEIKGKLNNGGIPVTVRASSSTIHLKMK